MSQYVLKRTSDSRYVADMSKSKTGGSYTPDIRQARFYPSAESARADSCPGNEYVANVQDELEGRQP